MFKIQFFIFSPFYQSTNVALGKTATQSSTWTNSAGFAHVAGLAVDGNISGDFERDQSVACTGSNPGEWWKVDLEGTYEISEIKVYNRDDFWGNRLTGFSVEILKDGAVVWVYTHPGGTPPYENVIAVPNVMGHEVEVSLPITSSTNLQLAEVIVMGVVSAQNQSSNLLVLQPYFFLRDVILIPLYFTLLNRSLMAFFSSFVVLKICSQRMVSLAT